MWLTRLGLYFIFVRPPLLAEDPRHIGSTLEQIQAAVPGLVRWLDRVFTVMGGFMSAAGVLGVMLMSAINFVIASNFRWLFFF